MKDISLRNVLLLLAAIIIGLLVLGFVSTLLNQLIPITIALVIGVVLGRMSVNLDLRTMLMSLIRRQKPAARQKREAAPAAQPTTDSATDDEVANEVEAIKQRLADTEAEAPQPEAGTEITDFAIKTEEEILAEARRREAEISRQSAAYDPAAALAERRRRLLGDQADES